MKKAINKNNNRTAIITLSTIIGVLLLIVALLSASVITQIRDDSAFIPNEDIVADTERNVIHIYEVYIVPEKNDDTVVSDIPDETIVDEIVTDVVNEVVDEIETETEIVETETEPSIEEVVDEIVDETVKETIDEIVEEDEVVENPVYWPVIPEVPEVPEIETEDVTREPEFDFEEETKEPEKPVVPEVNDETETEEEVTIDTKVDIETDPEIEIPTENEDDVKETVKTETETETETDTESETEDVEIPENEDVETVVRETKFSMANGENIVVTWNDEEIVDDVINDILYYLLLVEFDGDGETMKLTITGEDCIFYNDRVEYDGVVIGTLQGNIVSENTLVTEMSTSGVTLD
jgi:hypothetical protein